jgi:hypothetical protein
MVQMKVGDLRTVLAKYKKDDLIEIVVALYKLIPKNRKESEGLDDLISNFSKENKKIAKKDTTVDFYALEAEIEQLIEYADNLYYLAPNRYVNKDKRSKWRFEVKRFIKGLLAVKREESDEAAIMLARIYEMLSYCCNYYVFRTETPFTAVGYSQLELLDLVLGKVFHNGFDQESIKTAVYLTLDSNVDRDTLHSWLLWTLMGKLKTPDVKEIALSQCVTFIETYDVFQAVKSVFRYNLEYDNYRKNDCISYAAELYLIIKFSLYDYDDGISFYWKHFCKYSNSEITLYCLLEIIDPEENKDLWIREYENAVKKGIEPREKLIEEYMSLKSSSEEVNK